MPDAEGDKRKPDRRSHIGYSRAGTKHHPTSTRGRMIREEEGQDQGRFERRPVISNQAIPAPRRAQDSLMLSTLLIYISERP